MNLSIVPPDPDPDPGLGREPAPDDVALLRRSATGDAAAFAALYDRTAARIHGLVLRTVRNPAIAEEVTQEVFVEIWRLSARFDPARGSAIGWMLTIAHRRVVDRVRAEEASGRRDTTYVRTEPRRAHDAAAEEAERSIGRERVRVALASLTDVQRQSIELAYFGGYTHTEVAALLDIPVGTAKTRIRDGLIRLRDTLGASS